MNIENELLENQILGNFQVEELEKRFEMGWIDFSPLDPPLNEPPTLPSPNEG